MNTNEPDQAAANHRNTWRAVLLCAPLLFAPLCALAHDPFEITSTIRLMTNRTEVEIEMEFNAAMLLVGVSRSPGSVDQEGMFLSKLPELQRQAAQFFELADEGAGLSVTSTNVTRGVENHVKFNLQFPAAHGGLRVKAAGVKPLGEHGPFGTSVTVLDMVHLKVLGQATLFADSPVADFSPATISPASETKPATTASSPSVATVTNQTPAPSAMVPATEAPACCNGRWVLAIAAALALIAIWAIRKK